MPTCSRSELPSHTPNLPNDGRSHDFSKRLNSCKISRDFKLCPKTEDKVKHMIEETQAPKLTGLQTCKKYC